MENPLVNENNTFGFIRKFPYDNRSIHTINQLVHSNFILHGTTDNIRLFLAKMEGLPRSLNTYTELRNYLRNNRGAAENINIVFYEMHPDIDDDTGFEHIENVYIVRRSSSKIFFFVTMNDHNEIVSISDFFSFTHSKHYIGRRHRSLLQKNFDSLRHKEPNDFHYYTNSIFEKYDETRELQQVKPLFLFLINFYNV
ncbi:hypothetical protein PIROE2DRAFT_63668 [Piromyces sp. E2]|nr:hypothetical protein PIROE2DRAFT_63668 [Piromyces sp. E2]|eukprot:OUM59592.1 hypothetical protein PIROE2DRAFT_63668 [Piromyces sp. E2]